MSSIKNAIIWSRTRPDGVIKPMTMRRPEYLTLGRFLYNAFNLDNRCVDNFDLNTAVLHYRRVIENQLHNNLIGCIIDTRPVTKHHVNHDVKTLTLPADVFDNTKLIAVHTEHLGDPQPLRWFALLPSSTQPGTAVPIEFITANDEDDTCPVAVMVRLQDVDWHVTLEPDAHRIINQYIRQYKNPEQWPGMVERFMNQQQQQAMSWYGIVN